MLLIAFLISYVMAVAAGSISAGIRTRTSWINCIPAVSLSVLLLNALIAQIANILFQLNLTVLLFICICLCVFLLCMLDAMKQVHDRKGCRSSTFRFSKNEVATLISFLILLIFCYLVTRLQFGSALLPNYSSSDGATHLYSGEDIATGSPLTSRFFPHYLLANILIAIGYPNISAHLSYGAFILTDAFVFYIGSLLAFIIFKRISKRILPSLILTMLCFGGYHLNAIVFGFMYWDDGSYCLLLLAASLLLWDRNKGFATAFALLSIYGISITYNLFIPIGLLVVFMYFVYENTSWIKTHTLKSLIAGVLLIAFCFAGLSLIVCSGYVDGLRGNGYSYTEGFGSFVPLIPLVLCGLIKLIKTKTKDTEKIMISAFFTSAAIAYAIAFALFVFQLFSSYYFSKFYPVLWDAFFMMAAYSFCRSAEPDSSQKFSFPVCYLVLLIILFAFSISGFSAKLSEKMPNYPSAVADSFFGVYNANLREMRSKNVSEDEIELWEQLQRIGEMEGYYIPLLSDPIDLYWYDATLHDTAPTGYRTFQYWLYEGGDQEKASRLVDNLSGYSYVGVKTGASLPESFTLLDDEYETAFENSAGKIYKLTSN